MQCFCSSRCCRYFSSCRVTTSTIELIHALKKHQVEANAANQIFTAKNTLALIMTEISRLYWT